MLNRAVILAFAIGIFCLSGRPAQTQSFIKLTDEQQIQLALDMVRKGIQQQDTAKVFTVFASQGRVADKSTNAREVLSARLQAIFAQSSERAMQLARPAFRGTDSRLRASQFWDFDILEPQISICGDSAFVECELVLWGGAPDPTSPRHGKRVKERFILFSPPKVRTVPPREEYGTYADSATSRFRAWQVVGFESLLDFLGNQSRVETKGADANGGK